MRFSPNGKTDQFMYTGCNPDCDWPSFGSSGDLGFGSPSLGQVYNSSTHSCGGVNSYKNESCGGVCSGGTIASTYSASPNQVCGGFKNWGETEMEVWRLAD